MVQTCNSIYLICKCTNIGGKSWLWAWGAWLGAQTTDKIAVQCPRNCAALVLRKNPHFSLPSLLIIGDVIPSLFLLIKVYYCLPVFAMLCQSSSYFFFSFIHAISYLSLFCALPHASKNDCWVGSPASVLHLSSVSSHVWGWLLHQISSLFVVFLFFCCLSSFFFSIPHQHCLFHNTCTVTSIGKNWLMCNHPGST